MADILSIKNRLRNSKLANDSFWAIFGNVLGKGLSLLAVIVIARILGKEIYGEFGIVAGTIGSIVIFSNFGLNYTTTKYIAQYKDSKPELLSAIISSCQKLTLIFGGISTLALLLLAEYLAIYLLESPKLTMPLRMVAIVILINSISRTQIGILAGFGQFKSLAKVNAMVGIANMVTGVLLTYYYGLLGALTAFALIGILNCGLNRYFIRKQIRPTKVKRQNKITTSEILNFSVPIALQEALYSIITYSFGLLLVKFSTYGEVGLNVAATYWSALILFIPGMLRNVVLSHLSATLNNKKKRLRILRLILLFNFAVTALISVAVYILSGYIVSFYGDNFSGLKDVLNISVFTTIFISLSNVYAQAYMSESRNWLMLIFRIVRDGSIFLIAYFLITSQNGVNGALSLAKSALWANMFFLALMGLVYELKFKESTAPPP